MLWFAIWIQKTTKLMKIRRLSLLGHEEGMRGNANAISTGRGSMSISRQTKSEHMEETLSPT